MRRDITKTDDRKLGALSGSFGNSAVSFCALSPSGLRLKVFSWFMRGMDTRVLPETARNARTSHEGLFGYFNEPAGRLVAVAVGVLRTVRQATGSQPSLGEVQVGRSGSIGS